MMGGRRTILCLLAMVALTACPAAQKPAATDGGSSSSSSSSSSSPSATLKRSRLTLGLTAQPSSLCPLFGDSAAASEVQGFLFRELVQLTPEGLVPDLAATLPGPAAVQADGTALVRWTLASSKWSDGRPVVAADVVAGWKVARDESLAITTGRQTAQEVLRIDVVDEKHFTVVWKSARSLVAAPRLHRVLPAHLVLDNAGTPRDIERTGWCHRPVGNGAFMLKDTVEGASYRFVRNPHFSPVPGVDEVVVKIVPSTEALASALVAGDVDGTFPNAGLSPTEGARLVAEHPDSLRLVTAPGTTWVHLDFNLDDPWLKDVRLRRAIAMALDRRALVGAIAGDAYDVDEGFLPRTHSARASHTPTTIPFDVVAANALLDAAGWNRPAADAVRVNQAGKPLRLTLSSASGQRDTERLLQLIQGALRAVGVEVVLDLRPFKVFFGEGARKRVLPHLSFYAWVMDENATGLANWSSARIPSAANDFQGLNLPGWRNPEVDRLVMEAEAATTTKARDAALARVQDLFVDEIPALSFYFRPAVVVMSSTVSGLVPTGTASVLAWNAERWRHVPQKRP